jgi:hypothetical protein
VCGPDACRAQRLCSRQQMRGSRRLCWHRPSSCRMSSFSQAPAVHVKPAGNVPALRRTAGMQPSSTSSPIVDLLPLRQICTVVQGAIAQAENGALQLDNFVGSDLHRKLSKPYAFVDPDAQGVQQGCVEWHRARRQRVTASSVGRATGLLPMCDSCIFLLCWKKKYLACN